MRKLLFLLIIALFAIGIPTTISAIDKSNVPNAAFFTRELSACQVAEAERLIQLSRDAYIYGEDEIRNCPCPYDAAADGKRCGLRAANIRLLGEKSLCSLDDVGIEELNKVCSAAGV